MKILNRFNPLDFICLVLVLVSAAGFFMAKEGHAGVDQVITNGKAKVLVDIYFVGIKTTDPDMFKKGDNTALTIRNQPVDGQMIITNVKHTPKQFTYVSAQGKVMAADDPAQPYSHDYTVTISSDAVGTKDGYVVQGQKLKIGNQVELENVTYRVQGVVVGIHATR